MSKRYLGGGISFEQKNVYQEFSEESSEGSSTLSGLTDVDISNPSDGQTLVFNSTSGKWENGAGGGGGLVMPNISITMTGPEAATATCDMSRSAIVSAIENGAICIAKITGGPFIGSHRFVTYVTVVEGDEEEEASVVFALYDLMGGGDVAWYSIIVSDNSTDCFINITHSYNP